MLNAIDIDPDVECSLSRLSKFIDSFSIAIQRLHVSVVPESHNTSRLVFKPYNFEQIQDILKHRLAELSLEGFDDTIREFVARKAAHVGGASQLQNLDNSRIAA